MAISIAMTPDSFILDMVAYAWAGFGAAFGPALIMSLFWRRATRNGILAGVITGGLTVLIWKQFAFFGLYEIIPGFILALIAIYVVSLMDKAPSKEITDKIQKLYGILSLNQDAMQYLNSFMRFQMMLADVTNSIQDVVKEAMGEK